MLVSALVSVVLSAVQPVPPQSPPGAGLSLDREQVVGAEGKRLDAQLSRFEQYGFSGSVLVTRNRQVVLLKGYGLADMERGVRNTAATRFEMNSITKMFTSASILQLHTAGKVDLTASIGEYLGAFPSAKSGVTVNHLALHTAGLVVGGTSVASDTRDHFIADMKSTPRESEPGAKYRYSNAGFSVLAAIVEKVSSQPFEEYLRQNIFKPSGMRTAVFRNERPSNDPLFAHGYIGTPAGIEPGPPDPYVWGTIGAGGVWSTVGDVYNYITALEDGRILDAKARAILEQPAPPPAIEAYGWHVESSAARPRMTKGGGSDDFASQLLYYPRDEVVIVWASNNLRQRWRRTLNATLPPVLFNDSAVAMLPPIANVSKAMLQSRTGKYVSNGDTIEVRTTANYLYVITSKPNPATAMMFFPQSSSQFTGYDPSTSTKKALTFGADGAIELEDWKGVRATH